MYKYREEEDTNFSNHPYTFVKRRIPWTHTSIKTVCYSRGTTQKDRLTPTYDNKLARGKCSLRLQLAEYPKTVWNRPPKPNDDYDALLYQPNEMGRT